MTHIIEKHTNARGFTLIEIMVTMLLSAVVIGAVYSINQSQLHIYTVQNDAVAMQQNERVGMDSLSRDIRMAGYDPTEAGIFGFVTNHNFSNGGALKEAVTTSAGTIAFTADLDGDGKIDVAAQDANGDGNIDLTDMEQIAYRLQGTNLQRYSTTTGVIEWQTVAENIQNIEFFYTLANATKILNPTPSDLANIRSVTITILARAADQDTKFSGPTSFTTPGGQKWPLTADIRYQTLTLTVKCRNMGL